MSSTKTTTIVRRPDFAGGGITEAEREALAAHTASWIATALRTEPIVPARIVPATRVATDGATEWDWLQDLAEAVTPGQWPAAAKAITDWWQATQGGNHWVAWDCYLTAARDILGLRLPAHAAYAAWERCAREGSWRYLHPEFCLVSDFPEVLRQDDQHRPHCAEGPSHRWRDGWSLYHWHGVRVEPWVIETPADQLTVAQVHTEPNAEVRRVLMTRMGWARYLAESGATYVQADDYGWLYEIPLDGDRTMRVVRVINGTPEPEGADRTGCEPGRDGRWYKVYWLRVLSRCQTAREAVAWTNWCDDPSQYEEVVRT